jgi:hypothetical protein
MKMGIGIGWPNSTSGNGGIYTFVIQDCLANQKTVYSVFSQFLPNAYVFNDPELTIPFTDAGYWNLPELIGTIGGYEVSNTSGEVKPPLKVCPI